MQYCHGGSVQTYYVSTVMARSAYAISANKPMRTHGNLAGSLPLAGELSRDEREVCRWRWTRARGADWELWVHAGQTGGWTRNWLVVITWAKSKLAEDDVCVSMVASWAAPARSTEGRGGAVRVHHGDKCEGSHWARVIFVMMRSWVLLLPARWGRVRSGFSGIGEIVTTGGYRAIIARAVVEGAAPAGHSSEVGGKD